MLNNIVWLPVKGNQWTKVDLDDLADVINTPWCLSSTGYVKNTRKGLLHRVITKARPLQYVDHADGNKLNNTKSNLRLCTQSQNGANQDKRIHNSSGWKGVSKCKANNKWRVLVMKNYKYKHVGYFTDLVDAATAYNFAAAELHGEFAVFNTVAQPWLEDTNAP